MQTLFSCSNHCWDKRFSTWRVPGGFLEAPWRSLRVPGELPGGPWRVPGGSLEAPWESQRVPGVPGGTWRLPGGSLEGPWITKCLVFQGIGRVPYTNLVEFSSVQFSSVVQIIAGTTVSAPLVWDPIVSLHGQSTM